MTDHVALQHQIEWVDRETVAYRSGGLSVLIWVDYEAGLLSRGRVIHSESIDQWVDTASVPVRPVSPSERESIIAAVQQYYAQDNRPCRVEP
jgi:hypothetical protein